ncbi:MAG: hypothetical protein ACREA0_09625, partial [bacterium]
MVHAELGRDEGILYAEREARHREREARHHQRVADMWRSVSAALRDDSCDAADLERQRPAAKGALLFTPMADGD